LVGGWRKATLGELTQGFKLSRLGQADFTLTQEHLAWLLG